MLAEIILVFNRIRIVYEIDFRVALGTPVYFFIILYIGNENRYLIVTIRSSNVKIIFVRL